MSSAPPSRVGPTPPSCEHAEHWLAVHAREDVPKRYCRACEANCDGDADMPWPLLDRALTYYTCKELEYVALTIGAYHGKPVDSAFWKPFFEEQSWYRPGAPPHRLPPAARANLAWIGGLIDECRRDKRPVSASDWALVIDWFEDKDAGHPPLPKKLYVDGRPATESRFLDFLNSEEFFQFSRLKPVRYMDAPYPNEITLPAKTRVISVSTGDAGVGCVGWDDGRCGGFEWLEFYVDSKGTIVGLHAGAAACPFVYVAAESGFVLEGEVLRNLNRRSLEATQGLPLSSVRSCREPIVVRIAEEKQEATFVDAAHLVVDGERIPPDVCPGQAYCEDDGRYHQLGPGQTLELTFHASPHTPCRHVAIRVDGFYTPL